MCIACFVRFLDTPRADEVIGIHDIDTTLQLARRLVCFHCRSTERSQWMPGIFAPSQAVRAIAANLLLEGIKLKEGASVIPTPMMVRIEKAMRYLDSIIQEALLLHLDALASQALKKQRKQEREQARIIAAQSTATAEAAASTRREASNRRAGRSTKPVQYANTYVTCAGEVHQDNLNDPVYAAWRNYDSVKDKDYKPGQ